MLEAEDGRASCEGRRSGVSEGVNWVWMRGGLGGPEKLARVLWDACCIGVMGMGWIRGIGRIDRGDVV